MDKIKSLADQAYELIVEKIKLGELGEGLKVDEAALINEIGISRTPIREALLRLNADHVLESVPRKGFYVRAHNQEEMDNAYSIVACLEAFAIRQVMPILTDYDYAKMAHLIELMDIAISLKDYSYYVDSQEKFHGYCIDKVNNKILVDVIGLIKRYFPRQTYYNNDIDILFKKLSKTNESHQSILNAIKDKDFSTIEKLCYSHWCFENKPIDQIDFAAFIKKRT
ncbi:MAG: GntR family transcriptional regulator [Deltaproteobacteria bacterium]|jgi:DNA-binding GntR family transcriptional regulator|nr:GntR family transcriptional regulator [Deltaproteobacteria bacterium]